MNLIILAVIVTVMGLEFGSYANVCIYRWPRGQTVSKPLRSVCPWCRALIPFYDNIPLLSFILLKGRCRTCHSPISFRYPFVEMVVPVLWLSILFSFRPSELSFSNLGFLLISMAFVYLLVMATFIDWEWRIIPDQVSYSILILGVLMSIINPLLGDTPMQRFGFSVWGGIVGGGVPWIVSRVGNTILGKEVLGLGDVKLLMGFGAVLGWKGAFLGFLIGSLWAAVPVAVGLWGGYLHLYKNQYLPFGPFLSLGGYTTLMLMINRPPLLSYWLI